MAEDLHSGHRERLKARFLKDGLESFQPHNILELLLFFAVPRKDTNELAHRLIEHFGSLAEVLDAPENALAEVKGMTKNAAVLLKMIPELSSIYLSQKVQTDASLDQVQKLGEYFIPRFLGKTEEYIMLLCLDGALCPISCEIIEKGTLNYAALNIKAILQSALRHNSERVVIAHNHPRGIAVPSNEDILATRELKKGLSLLGIELVDHIVVSGNGYCSVLERYPEL